MIEALKKWYIKRIPFLLLVPSMIFIFFFLIYPLIYQTSISFSSATFYSKGKFIGLENYVNLFRSPTFRESIFVTFYFIAVSTSIELVWGMGLALALNRITVGYRLLQGLIILPLALTPIAIGSVWNYMYLPEGGVINTIFKFLGVKTQVWLADSLIALPALALVEIWQYTPFTVLILLAGLKAIPHEILEAAKVDGASKIHLLRCVILPMLASSIVISGVFNVMRQFKTFAIVYIISKGGPGHATNLISYHIYQIAYRFYKIGEAAALSFLLLGIIFILISLFMRYGRKFLKV